MKYLIRKVPERNVDYIIKGLLQDGVSKDDIMVFEDVNHEGCIWSFTEACRLCTDNTCFLQDDIILCKHFTKRLANVVNVYGNMVINLFRLSDLRGKNYNAKSKYGVRYLWEEFWYSFPGVYIPITVIRQYVDWYDKKFTGRGWQKFYTESDWDDGLFYGFLHKEGLPVYNLFPNLIQHKVGKSASGRKIRDRQTEIFIDSMEVK